MLRNLKHAEKSLQQSDTLVDPMDKRRTVTADHSLYDPIRLSTGNHGTLSCLGNSLVQGRNNKCQSSGIRRVCPSRSRLGSVERHRGMRPDGPFKTLGLVFINIRSKVADRVIGDVHFVVRLQGVTHLVRFIPSRRKRGEYLVQQDPRGKIPSL